MRLQVLYFAATRDLVGIDDEQVVLEGSATVAGLSEHLQQRHPALRDRLSAVRFAVNEQFAQPALELCDGDVVALIPPTAGG